jgi:Domain of unknown function (DUF6285)
MTDRPTAAELIAAVRQFLEGELMPTLTDARLRFQTLVAANVLAIVERELQVEEEHLLHGWQWLTEILEVNRSVPQSLTALRKAVRDANLQLCQRIRQGVFDERSSFLGLTRQLRQIVERKLEVANPRYLASFQSVSSSRGDGMSAGNEGT